MNHLFRRIAVGQTVKITKQFWIRNNRQRIRVVFYEYGTKIPYKTNLYRPYCAAFQGHTMCTKMNPEIKTVSGKTTPVTTGIIFSFQHPHGGMPGKRPCGGIPQTQRRFYTPRSISQQAIDGKEKTLIDYPDLQNLGQDNQYVQASFPLPVSQSLELSRNKLLCRPLGGIENMYNMYSSQGTDIICLMTQIETVYQIKPNAVRKALNLLQQRHPLLRMSIKESQDSKVGQSDFVEFEDMFCDFMVLDKTNWLQYTLNELESPFSGNGQPLIRYRMLNSTAIKQKYKNIRYKHSANDNLPDFRYQVTFLFIMHHSIMDGGYSLWIFQEFVNFLDAVVMQMDIRRVKELPILPPFEDIFTFSCNRDTKEVTNDNSNAPSLSFCHDSADDTVLNAYNKKFHNEIDTSSDKQLGNGCLVFKLSSKETKNFIQITKSYQCAPKGAISAACVLALLELVYGNRYLDLLDSYSMPIEFMADFRRIGKFNMPESVPHYPGVASFHVPLLAKLKFENSKLPFAAFWTTAKQFGECLDKNIDSPEVFEWVKCEASKYNRCPPKPETCGKSPYVLSLSNMGRCDGLLNLDVSGRVRLTDLHGHSNILVDDMPLFCVTTFALNGQFCGNVSYCTKYTSCETATNYVGLIKKYLSSPSKL